VQFLSDLKCFQENESNVSSSIYHCNVLTACIARQKKCKNSRDCATKSITVSLSHRHEWLWMFPTWAPMRPVELAPRPLKLHEYKTEIFPLLYSSKAAKFWFESAESCPPQCLCSYSLQREEGKFTARLRFQKCAFAHVRRRWYS
jgi:hypothetical protein